MRKDLETFVNENRPAFDNKKIDAQVWERINSARKKTEKHGLFTSIYFKWMAVAAAVLVIGGIFYFQNRETKEKNIPGETIVREQYPEFDAKIKSFASLIENKKLGLKVIQHEQPGIYDHFASDLAGLNSNYEKLKTELSANPNRNVLLAEMIENLELQLRLLNQQLELVRELKEKTRENNEQSLKHI